MKIYRIQVDHSGADFGYYLNLDEAELVAKHLRDFSGYDYYIKEIYVHTSIDALMNKKNTRNNQ